MEWTLMASDKPTKQENVWLNLLFNLVLPTVILVKFSSDKWFGPVWGLVVALAFPICYGLWDLAVRKKTNFISVLGFVSVLIGGGLGLLRVGGIWFAVKEAAVPALIGLAVLLSLRTKKPLVRALLYSDQVIDVHKVDAALDARNAHPAFERLLKRANFGLAGTFFLSAALNFLAARWLIHSDPGTEAFNVELGKMQTTGMLVTALPSMAMMMIILWKLVGGIRELTGLEFEAVLKGAEQTKPAATEKAAATETPAVTPPGTTEQTTS